MLDQVLLRAFIYTDLDCKLKLYVTQHTISLLRFADLTAKVFLSASIPVHMFTEVCATPLVSFGTILYNAVAGVMVTASHNPKEDNGYKVYWRNGCQIISPHDDNVLEEIKQCLE